MTGGGFGKREEKKYLSCGWSDKTEKLKFSVPFSMLTGGCTVSLVRASEIDNVIRQIDSEYQGATFYVCKASDGARVIDLGNLNWWAVD